MRARGGITIAALASCVPPQQPYPQSSAQPSPQSNPAAQAPQTHAQPPSEAHGQLQPRPMGHAPLVGRSVQDQTGPVHTYQRGFAFEANGTFVYQHTRRTTGSTDHTVLPQHDGTYQVRGNQLWPTPRGGGAPQAGAFRLDVDPDVGDARFVVVMPDGTEDVFYRR